jgi:hypothetical protein
LLTTVAGVIATKQKFRAYSPPWDGATERRVQRRQQSYTGPDRRGGGTTPTPGAPPSLPPGAPPPLPMGVPPAILTTDPKEYSRAA